MEASAVAETFVTICKFTRRHILEDRNFQSPLYEPLTSNEQFSLPGEIGVEDLWYVSSHHCLETIRKEEESVIT